MPRGSKNKKCACRLFGALSPTRPTTTLHQRQSIPIGIEHQATKCLVAFAADSGPEANPLLRAVVWQGFALQRAVGANALVSRALRAPRGSQQPCTNDKQFLEGLDIAQNISSPSAPALPNRVPYSFCMCLSGEVPQCIVLLVPSLSPMGARRARNKLGL